MYVTYRMNDEETEHSTVSFEFEDTERCVERLE